METNTTPLSAMAYNASPPTAKKVKQAATKTTAVETSPETIESTSEMLIRSFEELSNPEGYLYFSPF